MYRWLKKIKKPEYKKEYELYKIILFSVNEILSIIIAFLFFLKYGKEFNMIFLFFIITFYLLLNLYYSLKSVKAKQGLIFLNILILQYILYQLVEKNIYFIIPNVLFFWFLKEDFLILFFVFDVILLLFFYYLNVIYPSHRYEK
ncbi:MAG: hypothetical protein N3D10_00775 [Candidatus Micrarchaeota archaeon]|nr:hypothetical protein [Candidatus Micrarchaeota archaeon]